MTRGRSLILRPHEARRLAEHGDVLVVRVVKPQPHPSCSEDGCGWHWHHKGRDDHYMFGTDETHLADCMLDHCPFGRVGDELWGREAYYDRGDYAAIGRLRKDRYVYPANDVKAGWLLHRAVHMPRDASRFPRLVVDKIECRRIRSVTADEAVRTGLLSEWDRLDGRAYDNAEKAACRLTRTMFDRHNGSTAWNGDTWCWFATLKRSDAC